MTRDAPIVTVGRGHKTILLTALYLAQGLPYGFFTLALPVLLRERGYSLTAISLLSLLAWPWALKFLWAPYLDQVRSRKRWLLGLQTASVAGALLLTQLSPDRGMVVLLTAALAFNLIAASQDVLTDGLAVRMLGVQERGAGNGIQVGAYRVGMILGGGLLLWVFSRTNWTTMFLCMAGLLACTVLPVLWLRDPGGEVARAPSGSAQLAIGWAKRVLMPGMLGFAGLIFCYRFGDAVTTSLFGPFLKDVGLGNDTIALMKGTVGSGTSLLGAVLGGWFTFAVGRRTALLASGLAQAACFLLYIAAAFGAGGITLLWVATIAEGVISTMATVALFTLMMDACDPEHAGTDYTLFASFFVLVGTVGSFVAGLIADAFGYRVNFIVGTLLTVLGVLALILTLDRRAIPPRMAAVWRASRA